MIRIYDKDETEFDNLGLGSLDETTAAVVIEELNGSYEMEMEYPLIGRHFEHIQLRNIIFCKPNSYTSEQAFRIYSITKPFDGSVTINAEHISYDTSGVTILPIRNSEKVIESFGEKVTVEDKDGYYLSSILNGISAASAIQDTTKNYFTIELGDDRADEHVEDGYTISLPKNLRSILGGDDGTSILNVFSGEYLFDMFNAKLFTQRGKDRGLTIRYGKNMTDLEHESDGTELYTAIFPFYSKAYTETYTSTTPQFQSCYIRKGITPLKADWLSVTLIDSTNGFGGVTLKPVVETMEILGEFVNTTIQRYAPIIVATEDAVDATEEYYNKVYVFKKNTIAEGNLINVWVNTTVFDDTTVITEVVDDQGVVTEVASVVQTERITELRIGLDINSEVVVGEFGMIYLVNDEFSSFYNRKIVYDNEEFEQYDSDGFYVEAVDAASVPEDQPLPLIIPLYKISWLWDDTLEVPAYAWVRDDQNGSIYVRALMPIPHTETVDKYVYLDLLDYPEPEVSDIILEDGLLYVSQELKALSTQRVLTLDLTSELDSETGLDPTKITAEDLRNRAAKYLIDNDLTNIPETVTISFIKLSDSPEYEYLKELEVVELGDSVNVIHEELGVNSKHRVISTEYNVLSDSYNEIELGTKVNKITNNVVSFGDNISSLSNDKEYTDKSYVTDFVATNIDVVNAIIREAIITTLSAVKVDISGSLTASAATIDQLVADMLTSKNAKIAELLTAGAISVTGKITATSGVIGGATIEDGVLLISNINISEKLSADKIDVDSIVITNSIKITNDDGIDTFVVDSNGNATVNKITITGGTINIGGDAFSVDQNGIVTASSIYIDDAYVSRLIKTPKIETDVVQLGDGVSMYRVSTALETVQEVTMLKYINLSYKNTAETTVTVSVSTMDNKQLYSERTFKVSYNFKDLLGVVHADSVYVTIEKGAADSISFSKSIPYNYNQIQLVSPSSVFPASFTETKMEGGDDKVIVDIQGTKYDVAGSTAVVNGMNLITQDNEPDTALMPNNGLWFDTSND